MTDTPEIARIRAALEAEPTPGPWIGAGPSFGKPLPAYLDCVVQEVDHDDSAPAICRDTETDDANYIAACNPSAMADVLAHIDAQAAEIERLRKSLRYQDDRDATISTHGPGCHTWGLRHYECALREIERLRKDADRIEVLESIRQSHRRTDMHMGGTAMNTVIYQRTGVGSNISAKGSGSTVREAIDEIDAAMKEQK